MSKNSVHKCCFEISKVSLKVDMKAKCMPLLHLNPFFHFAYLQLSIKKCLI